MAILVIAEHDNASLKPATLNAQRATLNLNPISPNAGPES